MVFIKSGVVKSWYVTQGNVIYPFLFDKDLKRKTHLLYADNTPVLISDRNLITRKGRSSFVLYVRLILGTGMKFTKNKSFFMNSSVDRKCLH